MSEADPSVVANRAANVLSGIYSQVDAMIDRLEGFLAYCKAKVGS
jgi:hypothetical protein